MKLGVYIVYLTCILICLIAAIIHRKELANRKVGFFIPYLLYIFIQETVFGILSYTDPTFKTAVGYNLYRILTVIIFAIFFCRVNFMKKFHRLITWSAAFFVVFSIVDHIFFEPITSASSILNLVRGFILIFFGILFLASYMQIDSRKIEQYWRPFLWITIGIVIFYPVVSIVIYLQTYLNAMSAMLGPFKLYQLIPQVMSIFMYSCFTYAFHLCRKIKEPI